MNEQSAPNPYTLDTLFAEALSYANFCFKQFGYVRAAFFLCPDTGPIQAIFHGGKDFDEAEKQKFSTVGRMACVAHLATVCVFVSEGWTVTRMIGPDEKFNISEQTPPSESPDRKEVVICIGETKAGVRPKSYEIIRDGQGKCLQLTECAMMTPTNPSTLRWKGRFTHFLPDKEITPKMQELAKIFLQFSGIRPLKPDAAN